MFYCYFLPNIFRNAWLFSVAVVITRSVCHCGFRALTLIVIYAHSFAFYLFGVFPYSTQTHNRVHIVATKLTHITYLTHCAFFHFVFLFPPTHLARWIRCGRFFLLIGEHPAAMASDGSAKNNINLSILLYILSLSLLIQYLNRMLSTFIVLHVISPHRNPIINDIPHMNHHVKVLPSASKRPLLNFR